MFLTAPKISFCISLQPAAIRFPGRSVAAGLQATFQQVADGEAFWFPVLGAKGLFSFPAGLTHNLILKHSIMGLNIEWNIVF